MSESGYHDSGRQWNRYPIYECDFGDFESVREELVAGHVKLTHPDRPTGLVSPSGDELSIPATPTASGQTDTESEEPAAPASEESKR